MADEKRTGIHCSYCGKELLEGEPEIVIDYGEAISGGINAKFRVWEGHLACFIKMIENGELDSLLATLYELQREEK